jgi:hypothetical protein
MNVLEVLGAISRTLGPYQELRWLFSLKSGNDMLAHTTIHSFQRYSVCSFPFNPLNLLW